MVGDVFPNSAKTVKALGLEGMEKELSDVLAGIKPSRCENPSQQLGKNANNQNVNKEKEITTHYFVLFAIW